MLNRRELLKRTLRGSSLVAFGAVVPQFLRNAARAAEVGGDTILVVLELTGGNDGLNTVIPYADDGYHEARPTLRYRPGEVVHLNDSLGLNPKLQPLEGLWHDGHVAIVQGVGYPNTQRTHLHSLSIWQTADPRQTTTSGWLARSFGFLATPENAGRPAIHVGASELPKALSGSHIGV